MITPMRGRKHAAKEALQAFLDVFCPLYDEPLHWPIDSTTLGWYAASNDTAKHPSPWNANDAQLRYYAAQWRHGHPNSNLIADEMDRIRSGGIWPLIVVDERQVDDRKNIPVITFHETKVSYLWDLIEKYREEAKARAQIIVPPTEIARLPPPEVATRVRRPLTYAIADLKSMLIRQFNAAGIRGGRERAGWRIETERGLSFVKVWYGDRQNHHILDAARLADLDKLDIKYTCPPRLLLYVQVFPGPNAHLL